MIKKLIQNKTVHFLECWESEEQKAKFRNKNGDLTRYSFTCGYIQEYLQGCKKLQIYQDGCFHVRAFNTCIGKRLFWESFDCDNLTRARRYFNTKKRVFKSGEE